MVTDTKTCPDVINFSEISKVNCLPIESKG